MRIQFNPARDLEMGRLVSEQEALQRCSKRLAQLEQQVDVD